jgi:hypothetical protein
MTATKVQHEGSSRRFSKRVQHVSLIAAACAGCAPAVWAQPWQGRVLIDANAAMSTTKATFNDSFSYKHPYSANIPGEEASVDTTFEIPRPVMFEGGALVRVYRNVAAGFAFYQSSDTNDLHITARIPHPFFIGQHRTVEGVMPVGHEENGFHLMGAYVLPLARTVYVGVSAGPSYFSVTQRMVKSVAVTETYPFDTASFASADVEPVTRSGWGFNVGADVGWMFIRHLGVGGLVRYSKATLSLQPTGRDARDIDVGGLHVGLGARIAF